MLVRRALSLSRLPLPTAATATTATRCMSQALRPPRRRRQQHPAASRAHDGPFSELLRAAEGVEGHEKFDDIVGILREHAEREHGRELTATDFPALKRSQKEHDDRNDLVDAFHPLAVAATPDEPFFDFDGDVQETLDKLKMKFADRQRGLDLAARYGSVDPADPTNPRFFRGAHNFENFPHRKEKEGSVGFRMRSLQRQWLTYMRLIENEMFMLQGMREEFVPPTADQPLVVKTIHYNGERHPVTRKRTLTVPVALLPLRDDVAIHKFKLLAGPRWSQRPPTDSGIGDTEIELWGNEGYLKMAVEDLSEPIQNLKFASDVLDNLIATANDTAREDFTDIPLDERHVAAYFERKPKFDRFGHQQSAADFPTEWLHLTQPQQIRAAAEEDYRTRERERGDDFSFDKKEDARQRWTAKREWMQSLTPEQRDQLRAEEDQSDEFDVYHSFERWAQGRAANLNLPEEQYETLPPIIEGEEGADGEYVDAALLDGEHDQDPEADDEGNLVDAEYKEQAEEFDEASSQPRDESVLEDGRPDASTAPSR